MQASSAFKRAFLHLMLKGLKQNVVHSKSMSIQERKEMIKLSADAAMAIARGNTKWSSALIAGLLRQEKTKNKGTTDKKATIGKCSTDKRKIPTSKRILKRSLRSCSMRNNKNVAASEVARRMMKKRTQLLKKIIPGCESLNRLSFLSQTVDYVIHLQAQVNLMQSLAKALGTSSLKSQKSIQCKKEKLSEIVDETCGDQMYTSRVPQPQEEESRHRSDS